MKEFHYQEVAPHVLKKIEEGAFLVVKGKERVNVMTIGWAMLGIVWRRPMMMVAVRTSRFTHPLIEEADSFTVSVPAGAMKKEINFCGSESGRRWDKFKECGLATRGAQKVSTPVLGIPGYHFECRIVYKNPMDPKLLSPELESIYPAKDFHGLYFGEIVASYLTES
jgi:flavin reductase (DIM6/NTAB) family NADH-FMN oxidoreductase RutF